MARAKSIYSPKVWPTWLALGLLRLLVLLPRRWILAIGRGFGRLAEGLISSRRHIVDKNLELCYPDLTEAQRRELRRRHFEAVGMGVMEFAISYYWPDERLLPLVDIEGSEHLPPADSGQGVILLSMHTTPLEIGGRMLHRVRPIHAMYRRNENPVLQRFLEHHRGTKIGGIIPKDQPRPMMRLLKSGGAIWYAPDQNYKGKNRVFADFFGIPASTNPGTSRFAAVTGAKVFPAVVLRTPAGRYRVIIERPWDDFPSGDDQQDARRMNQQFEDWIAQAPEQYNWLHRRFKTRPQGEAKLYH